MIIGFIGFGKVSRNLKSMIKSDDVSFITSFEGRSSKTIQLIESEDIEVADTFKEVAQKSDILISANSPKSAIEVAEKYGIPVTAKIPMDPSVAAKCDAGDIEYCDGNWLEPVTNVLAQLG